jgi:hypothetical protein
MKLTRRNLMAGAMAVPALAALGDVARAQTRPLAAVYDPDLPAGQRLASLLRDAGHGARVVEGDRIRLAREVLGQRLPLLAGVTRSADALLFAEVAAEEGYDRVLELRGNRHGCSGFTCNPDWNPLNRNIVEAGQDWLGAFAGFVANPAAPATAAGRVDDDTMAMAWLLVRKV